jgi:hypothetical protein
MAGIIELTSAVSGSTNYAVINNASGQRWNGTTFESFNGANWSAYVNPLTEDRFSGNGTGYYKAAFPGAIAAGRYTFTFYQQLGGSPALGDTTIGSGGPMYWTGAQEDQGSIVTVLALLNATAIPELSGIPGPTPTLFQALMLLYMSLRNIHTATSSQESITNNAGSTITSAGLSDNGTTYTKAQFS